jgi:hypothetical protein
LKNSIFKKKFPEMRENTQDENNGKVVGLECTYKIQKTRSQNVVGPLR